MTAQQANIFSIACNLRSPADERIISAFGGKPHEAALGSQILERIYEHEII